MSRSYKKRNIVKDKNKGAKRLANKKVRRNLDIPSGKSFRKFFSGYDICDWIFERSFKEYYNFAMYLNTDKSEKELYAEWYKIYKMK